MLSSFSTFSYNLVMEILIHSSFINCICLYFLPFHYPKILTQNFLTTSKSTLFTLWNLKVLLCFYYLKLACKVWISKKGMLSLSHTFTLFSTNQMTASTVKIPELCCDQLEDQVQTVEIPLHCCTIIKRKTDVLGFTIYHLMGQKAALRASFTIELFL